MTSIGQSSLNSSVQILITVEVDNLSFEVLFHVLPDHCLRHNIMIGRESLFQGLAVNMTSDRLNLTKLRLLTLTV